MSKKGTSGKAALDEQKIAEQLKNPVPLESPSPEPTPQLAPFKYNYEPKNTSEGQPKEPAFSINPPSDWQNANYAVSASFVSPDKDEEKAEGDLVYTQPANIQVNLDFLENYDKLEGQNLSESQILDAVIANDIKKTMLGPLGVSYISDQRTRFAGQEAHLLEFTVETQYGAIEHVVMYVLVKDKYGALVSGHALDSAWSKRASTLKSSLSTFKFTD